MIVGGSPRGSPLTRIDDGAIRGSFRKGKIGGYDTGFTWYSRHARGYNEVSMAYRVKFSSRFDWKKGGKLPGLCGGGMDMAQHHQGSRIGTEHCRRLAGALPFIINLHELYAEGRGSVCPVGCSTVSRDRGFSMRLMWRQNGGAVSSVQHAHAVLLSCLISPLACCTCHEHGLQGSTV